MTTAAGRRFAALAFGPAAHVYEALTGSEPWRASCRRMSGLVPGPLVLDLGVGPGESSLEALRATPGRRGIGLDLSAVMVRRAAARAARAGVGLPVLRADAQRLPVRTGSLDGITGHSVLYLLGDPVAALAEAARGLRPGGRAAFLEPAMGHPGWLAAAAEGPRLAASMAMWRVMSGLHRRFDAAALTALLSSAGLREVHVEPALSGFAWLASGTR
jgi:ubiquinone/menaquinone biosynthesis C-methylase UbiE